MKIQKKILIVDDNLLVREMSADLLNDSGFTTTCAGTCYEALVEMEKQRADAVLLDIGLPDEDGLDFLPKFKKLHPTVPVIILTGLGYDETKMQLALRNGAVGYVSKDVDVENMVVAFRNILR